MVDISDLCPINGLCGVRKAALIEHKQMSMTIFQNILFRKAECGWTWAVGYDLLTLFLMMIGINSVTIEEGLKTLRKVGGRRSNRRLT